MKPDARLSMSLVEDGESPGANGATDPASRHPDKKAVPESNSVGGRQNMRGAAAAMDPANTPASWGPGEACARNWEIDIGKS